jgi:uncharacterized protein
MGRPVVHFEIGCRDAQRTRDFLAGTFGWKMKAAGPSILIDTEGHGGINGHITALGHDPHSYVTVYVEVDDLAGCLAKAESLGGRTVVPPSEVPGQGHFAWLADPDGNTIGLWKPLHPHGELGEDSIAEPNPAA